jgi:hypothetical protein
MRSGESRVTSLAVACEIGRAQALSGAFPKLRRGFADRKRRGRNVPS